MFRITGIIIAVLGLFLGISEPAEAHGAARHGYDSYTYRHGTFHRARHMPRWLWHKRGFRRWYFRTPLRFNYHLTWWQLHDAYRWERRHSHRQYRYHYGPRRYDNGRDWRDDDRRGRRPNQRRRNRDD